ncbi:hypothetical protein Y032_0210g2156 [Ancylostoma ceylanicum]|uniref:Integrase catalytic domain-containing protein n=1 Tax=Ancylostoma ceylanicum TaxID=53326 RepID=A0A016SLA6_9BILA|nr:hypothetical protein Y032_0210g2156 [Ancylostoma ceylanicum]
MIHLELITGVSTTAVINAFYRFVARRGAPESITCDNAPACKLGREILAQTMTNEDKSEKVQQFLARAEIEWKFITPYAPWQGGFYERLMQSVKRSMYKAIGKQVLDFEALYADYSHTWEVNSKNCLAFER